MTFDFQTYLEAIVHCYSQQRVWYTPTDLLLPLEAQIIRQRDTPAAEPDNKLDEPVGQIPVLEGLRKYVLGQDREHVLLAGRPSSGKSTALRQLAVVLAEEGQVPVLVQLKIAQTVPQLIKSGGKIRSKTAIQTLLKELNHSDIDISCSAVQALKNIDYKLLTKYLPHLQKSTGLYVREAISSIQNQCQFYNYEIWQEACARQSAEPNEQDNSQRGVRISVTNNFPNAREAKIFEQVGHYHESPSLTQDSS